MPEKIIESQFQSLRTAAFPDATGTELEERRRMFFAGFAACFSVAMSEDTNNDEKLLQNVAQMNEELDEFNAELQASR